MTALEDAHTPMLTPHPARGTGPRLSSVYGVGEHPTHPKGLILLRVHACKEKNEPLRRQGAPLGDTRLSPQQNGGSFGELGPAWTSPQPVRSVKVIGKRLGVY